MTPAFSTEVRTVPGMPGVRMLLVSGQVTHEEAPDLRERVLGEVLSSGASRLVVDLGGVGKMDTAGVAVLVESLFVSRQRGVGMLLCAPSESVLQIFRLAGLHDALESCCSGAEEVQQKLMG